MKLSTRSRYGTKMIADLAEHYNDGPVQIGEIANRQDLPVKYLEQLIIPLKKAGYIKSSRGPKGGHTLAKPPDKISVGEIVQVLEGSINLTPCIENPEACEKYHECATKDVWEAATKAMYNELDSVKFSELIKQQETQ